jgi:hypothetical protein
MGTYTVELVGVSNKLGDMSPLAVDLGDSATLAELTSALRQASPELVGSVIESGADRLAGHYTFNVNGRFHIDEYGLTVRPGDRILIVTLAMGG